MRIRPLLGIYGDEDLSRIADLHKRYGNFYLIIDALDSNPTKIDYPIFNQLIDIISLYKDRKWLKVIISIRSGVCANNWHSIIDSQQKWFLGFMAPNSYINVPMLDYNEIVHIADNLRPSETHQLDLEMLPDLSYPLCLQFIYQNDSQNFSLQSSNEFSVFEAVSSYFFSRIYRNRHKDEIWMLLMALIEEMDIANEDYTVNSLDVYKTLKEYEKSYYELLNLGFLQEINISKGINFINNISIVSRHALNFILARKIVKECNFVFDDKLVNRINSEFNISMRSDLLKWCIYMVISSGNRFNFDLLKNVNTKIAERTGIGLFLVDLLKKFPVVLYLQPAGDKLNKNIDYLFGLEYLGKKYDKILYAMLSFNLPERYVIISRTYIAFMAICQLDMKKLESQIAELKSFPAVFFQDFFINPLNCLEAIYYYLRFGIIQKEPLAQLTGFYFNPVIHRSESYPAAFDEILHLIGLYTLSICNNEKKTMRFILALKKIYPSGSICYNFLFRILKSETYLSLGKKNDAHRVLQHLGPYYDQENSSLTGFMNISYKALKAKLENLNTAPDINQIDALTRLCDDEQCNLIKAHSLAFILKNNSKLKNDKKFFNHFYFNLEKTTCKHGCKANRFDI